MSDNIPPPLIVDILSKLPVKSLCRFRCVSKPWLALINHPRFSKIHLSRTHEQRLLLQKKGYFYYVELETISSLRNSVPVKIEIPGIKIAHYNHKCEVIGCCNGLLCIKVFRNSSSIIGLVLCNPSTKECKLIPNLPEKFCSYILAFGYAESIDDYKIVCITLLDEKKVMIYSLRKQSWIYIRSDFEYDNYELMSAFVNGAIHFVFSYEDQPDERPNVIAAFDLVEDKFKTLPTPDFMLEKRKYLIGCLSGCLCFSKFQHKSIELWVMKEYGVTGSWTKILTTNIGYSLQPLCYLNNSETLLAKVEHRELVFPDSELVFPDGLVWDCIPQDKVMFWDSKDEEFKDTKIDFIDDDYILDSDKYCDNWCPVDVYTESLVSINRIKDFTIEDDEELLGYWYN